MKKSIIIFLPTGTHQQYSTIDMNDGNVLMAKEIRLVSDHMVVIVETDDTHITFCGCPFQLDEWDHE